MGEIIGIHLQSGPVLAYAATPTLAERSGSVLLLHDIWGLDDHTKGVADRLASQGYHVLAPNLLAGTEMEKRIRPDLQADLFGTSTRRRALAQAQLHSLTAPLRTPRLVSVALMRAHACFEYLYNQPQLRQQVSVIGFGMGGTQTFGLAIREPRLMTSINFYGQVRYTGWELRHINCPVMAFYGDKDMPSMESLIRMRPLMQEANIDFTPIVYDGAGPYFFNDSIPGAYDSHAAADSWSRTLAFLRKYMR